MALGLSVQMRRLLVGMLSLAVAMPLMLAGIVLSFFAAMRITGVAPDEKSWTAVGLAMLFVPLAALLGCMLGYALLLFAFRVMGREEWFETPEEFAASRRSAPFQWVRTLIGRLLPPFERISQ